MDNNVSGVLLDPSSYFMKTPREQYRDEVAKAKVESFIQKYGSKKY